MGRHSRPDEPDEIPATDLSADTAVEVPAVVAGAGRHAQPEAVQPDDAAAAAVVAAPAARSTGTRADLRMLRDQPALRARCVAAIVVPFLAYALVLLVIGRTDVFLLWIWIPMVAAGVLFGSFLDAAHRRAA